MDTSCSFSRSRGRRRPPEGRGRPLPPVLALALGLALVPVAPLASALSGAPPVSIAPAASGSGLGSWIGPRMARAQEPDVGPVGGAGPDDGARAALRLTLDEAVDLALRNSPDLAVSAAELDRAESVRLSAWGSFLPRIEAGYAYSTSSSGRLDPTGQAITNTSWSTELTASYDLFSGFRRFGELGAARGRVDAAGALHREQTFRTTLDVKTAWFSAVASRDLVRLAADRVERQRAQLASVRVQFEHGRASRPDVLRSEIALNQARLELVRARGGARAAALGLAAAIGAERTVEPATDATLTAQPEPLELTREQVRALASRTAPSVVSAEAAAEAASAAVAAARSSYLPSLTIAGGYAWQSAEFPPQDRSWQIFLFGSYPLFDGFQRENRVGQASADARAAEARARAARLEMRAAADSAWFTLEAARTSIGIADRTVELTREELGMQQELFAFGRGSILELQTAQIALAEAEVASVQARFDYRTAVARLEFLLGRELEDGAVESRAGDGGAVSPM